MGRAGDEKQVISLQWPKWEVASWVAQVSRLAAIAATQPYADYATFIFGLQHRWTFLQHTMPKASEHMQLLKDAIQGKLIPMLIMH